MPQHVIVSTPNSEYNVLFPNFSGFRHWDHKFEWTRREFSQWCKSVCSAYPYSMELTGLGDPTVGFEHVGFCTQVAIFTRQARSSEAEEVWQSKRSAIGKPYAQVHSTAKTAIHTHTKMLCLKWIMSCSVILEQVAEGIFPVASPVPRRQKLHDEIRYHVSSMVATSKQLGDETRLNDDGSWTFPLSDLMQYPSIQKYFKTVDDIR